jgi:hypothetical protein
MPPFDSKLSPQENLDEFMLEIFNYFKLKDYRMQKF